MKSNYLKEPPKCRVCGKPMILNDIDFNFKGNQDEYYDCPFWHESALVKIRYSKVIKIERSKL